MRLFIILSIFLLTCACARTEHGPITTPKDCPELFVILPGNYIIDLAAGANVVLNPAVQEFALFCSAKEAKDVLHKALQENAIPADADWRLYRLNGGYELAIPCNGNNLCLGREASVADWVAEDSRL